jgi:hypothetical protein
VVMPILFFAPVHYVFSRYMPDATHERNPAAA